MAWKSALKALAALAAAAASRPAGAQREIVTDGPYVHVPARAVYPLRVGEFQRSRVYQYDGEGKDVSASYDVATPEGRLLITVYIYPAAPAAPSARVELCAREFDSAETALSSQHGNIGPVDRGEAVAAKVAPGLGRRSVYRFSGPFDDRVQEIRSEIHLYCYVGGDWLVKYRVSAPIAVETSGPVDRFIRLGPWPGRSPPNSIAFDAGRSRGIVLDRGTPLPAQR